MNPLLDAVGHLQTRPRRLEDVLVPAKKQKIVIPSGKIEKFPLPFLARLVAVEPMRIGDRAVL